MQKTIFFIVLFLHIAVASQVSAHTQLVSSDPEEGEVVTEELHDITLTFGENIEEGSTFELLDADGNSLLDAGNITIEGDEVVGTLPYPLADGEYEVDWYTISADGHPIEGAFTFTVDLEESSAGEDNTGDEAGNNENSIEKEVNNNGQDGNTDNSSGENLNNVNGQEEQNSQAVENEPEQTEENDSAFIVPLITAGLIAVMIGIFIWLRKRDK